MPKKSFVTVTHVAADRSWYIEQDDDGKQCIVLVSRREVERLIRMLQATLTPSHKADHPRKL